MQFGQLAQFGRAGRAGRGGKGTATAVAVAVIGGLLGGAQGAAATPGGPGAPAATAPDRDAEVAPERGTAAVTGRATTAAPSVPAPRPGTDRAAPTAVEGRPPAVWPRPQSLRTVDGAAVRLGDEVVLVAEPDTDPYAVAALEGVLRDAGVRKVRRVGPEGGALLSGAGGGAAGGASPGAGGAPGGAGTAGAAGTAGTAGAAGVRRADGVTGARETVVWWGGTGAQSALRALRAPERGDLPSGGYRLAAGPHQGRDTIAVDGVGPDGLFHAVQTLRQLITSSRSVPRVVVRDWPGTAVRGLAEGFYGRPWSHEQRLAQLDFMGRTKQNRYLYAPGDDPYRQARWREPYPAGQRAEFRELADRARRNHVTLAWAVAPAQSMCLASEDDVKALKRKVDAMYALGVRAFQLQFQDSAYDEWHCSRDAEVFGRGPGAAARAHARVASELSRHLADRHPDAEPLSLMPTEYYQDGATEYRTALADALDARVQVAWTGVGVVPRTISGGELAEAREVFRRPLVTMDNYPVNDYAQDRIFLGPYTGREPAVAAGSAALLANGMEQASASRVPVFTAADFAWNPRGYRPQESWQAALDDLAGGDPRAREALGALAGNDASSLLDPHGESAYLRPLLAEFWRTRTTTGVPAAARDAAAAELRAAFTVMRGAPAALTAPAEGRLDDEVRPWLDQLARYGRAGEAAVDMLQAQARGDGAAAWRAQLELEPLRQALAASTAKVGTGVLDPFLKRAVDEAGAWTGASRKAGEPYRTDTSYTVDLGRARPVEAVTALADPGGPGGGAVEVHVPGEGWRRLGPLSPSGWTQARVAGALRVDAVRVSWAAGEAVPVRSLVPWFADEPRVGLELPRAETDAVIGGRPQRVDAVLSARRPEAVRGALAVRAPKGVVVSVPKETTVPRGVDTRVPLTIRVPKGTPAGSYPVTLSFAGEERTLTVRAYPATGGADLTRSPGAAATSSGDETPDFPASAAVDGDPDTRWSSPAEDGAWWQVELAEPARVGQVVLQWQDAHAKRYRVQVSPDGRSWRTAATVSDGRGGREAVRMDAPDTRFLRIQGEERATEYGYSLFDVQAYAVVAE
ncbi:beta-N-acetylglucosaminidase domain-containing protein [Streptomyces sp. enrichment culture]|uniref:beta-N-acetylglucosaminidase domain-containing protein n=1 Tax=Streptomyces sp. enrichment culture TaxID=1795815 RepID=UPI003F559AFC